MMFQRGYLSFTEDQEIRQRDPGGNLVNQRIGNAEEVKEGIGINFDDIFMRRKICCYSFLGIFLLRWLNTTYSNKHFVIVLDYCSLAEFCDPSRDQNLKSGIYLFHMR